MAGQQKHRKTAFSKLGIMPGLSPESVPHQMGDGSKRNAQSVQGNIKSKTG